MSLLHASALLAGRYDIIIVDQRLGPNWRTRLKDALGTGPVALGVTTLTGRMVANALEMVAAVRECSVVPVVWGGTHVTMVPERAIESPAVDFLVLGEGEVAFAALVDRLARGEPVHDLDNVWAKRGKTIHRNRRTPALDYAGQPMAPYHVVDMENYMYSSRGHRAFDYLSSRGCPHGCTYCYNTVFYGSTWSARSAETVVEELKALSDRYGFDVVYFLDDNFFIDRKRAWEIVRAMPALGLKYEIQGVDIQTMAGMNDEELDLLEETGLLKMTIGVESASDRIRHAIRKWGDFATVLATLRRLAGRRFLVLTSFIIGFPSETWDEIDETVRLALRLQSMGHNFRFPQFYSFTPIQGTPIADSLVEAGFEFPATLEDWKNFDWDHCLLYRDEPGKRRRLEAIAFLSKFIDRKHEDYGSKRFVSLLYQLYRPVAFARLSARLYGLLPEKTAYGALKWFNRFGQG